MKKLGLPRDLRTTFYEGAIRSRLEYASSVFHHSLTTEDTDRIEAIQRRAQRSIDDNIDRPSLASRRDVACAKMFEKLRARNDPMIPQPKSKTHERSFSYVVDGQLKRPPPHSTQRYLNSFIPAQTRVYNDSLNVNSTMQKRKLVERKEGTLYSQK